MEFMSFVWLGVTILASIIEAVVPALVSIWFVPGGLAALIVSMCGGPLWLQVLLFLLLSALAIFFTRPLARKMQEGQTSTNADMALGQDGVVTQEINNLLGVGRVTVRGNSWAARSADHTPIPVGKTVTVERIEGVKLIVTLKETDSE